MGASRFLCKRMKELKNPAPEAKCGARSRSREPTGPPRLPRGVLAARKWTRECPFICMLPLILGEDLQCVTEPPKAGDLINEDVA